MYKRIGASECLERDRGHGGPPSGMEWSAFAEQTKKRWRPQPPDLKAPWMESVPLLDEFIKKESASGFVPEALLKTAATYSPTCAVPSA